MLDKSFDSRIPVRVAISAMSLIGFGIVVIIVFCRVEAFVIVPIKTDASIRRVSGLIIAFVSPWVLWRVRGCPVMVVSIICVL